MYECCFLYQFTLTASLIRDEHKKFRGLCIKRIGFDTADNSNLQKRGDRLQANSSPSQSEPVPLGRKVIISLDLLLLTTRTYGLVAFIP